MEAARLERMIVDIGSVDGQVGLRANGQVVLFDGFLKVYEEGRDEPAGDGDDKRLPQLNQGEPTEKKNISPEQHFTQPPPRYTEATLVKRMEELGIGRPSTYASIVTTIQDREYVRKDQNRLVPEDKGRIVTIFLLNFFKQYVEYDFTAALETQLDHVSAGDANYKVVLAKFWKDFSVAIAETSDLRISQVLDVLDDALAPQLYPPKEDGSDPKACPLCGAGQLHLKTSRTGGFVGCGNYPECRYTRQLGGDQQDSGERVLGEDGGDEISLRSGRFGPYIQRGDVTENSPKPSRASLPKGWSASDMDLEKALTLLSLPRQIGPHPEDGEMVEAGIGRYGPFVKHGRIYANLKEVDDVFTIGMNRAVEEIARKLASRGGAGREQAKPLRELGEHPIDGGPVNVYDGRYGPYVKFGKINATLPKGVTPEAVTMDVAVALVTEKAAKKGSGKAKPKAKPKAKAKAPDK
jgi:DNA topoisomerase-1